MLIGISGAGSVEEMLRMLDKVCWLICSVLTVESHGIVQTCFSILWRSGQLFGSCGRVVGMQDTEGAPQGVV